MRFATYNIWNSPTLQQARREALITALVQLDADVIALQEVPTAFGSSGKDAGAMLAEQSQYPYSYFRAYPSDPGEGLAILSRHPLLAAGSDWDESNATLPACAIGAEFTLDNQRFVFTNTHLDWSSIVSREQQILRVLAWHTARKSVDSLSLLAGDFNAIPDSSIYRFLMGQQSLGGVASLPWIDLAACDAFVKHTSPAATLDFVNNPRWANTTRLEPPMRVDWLLLGAEIEQEVPRLQAFELFGTEPLLPSNVVPSDHYGVYADLLFV